MENYISKVNVCEYSKYIQMLSDGKYIWNEMFI